MPDEAPAFFVPYAKDSAESLSVWQSVRDFMKMQGFQTSSRRIYSIGFTHEGQHHVETVGQRSRYIGEEIFVILAPTNYPGMLYLLCSPNRGVLRGEPAMVGSPVWGSIDFPPGD